MSHFSLQYVFQRFFKRQRVHFDQFFRILRQGIGRQFFCQEDMRSVGHTLRMTGGKVRDQACRPEARLFLQFTLRSHGDISFFIHFATGKHPDIFLIKRAIFSEHQNPPVFLKRNDVDRITGMQSRSRLLPPIGEQCRLEEQLHSVPPVERIWHVQKRNLRNECNRADFFINLLRKILGLQEREACLVAALTERILAIAEIRAGFLDDAIFDP